MEPTSRRLRLLISYDGHPFRGWQSQADGRGVQDHLEAAFARLCGGERLPVHGSGRTDTGVHALGQVAHVDVPATRLAPEQWRAALNAHLVPKLRVLECRWARPGFHARFDAKGKVYRYRLWNGPVFPPLELGRAWHVPVRLDAALLREAAQILTGRHDFRAFSASRGRGQDPADTVRHLGRIGVTGKPGGLIALTFEGEGFLYKMVRLLTGSVVYCAQGKAPASWLSELLDPRNAPAKTSHAAPAEGLALVRVRY